jgi:hypothetical protein
MTHILTTRASSIFRSEAIGDVILRNKSHILSEIHFKPVARVIFSCKKRTSVGVLCVYMYALPEKFLKTFFFCSHSVFYHQSLLDF